MTGGNRTRLYRLCKPTPRHSDPSHGRSWVWSGQSESNRLIQGGNLAHRHQCFARRAWWSAKESNLVANRHLGYSQGVVPATYSRSESLAVSKGFEPSISAVTGQRPLQAGPRDHWQAVKESNPRPRVWNPFGHHDLRPNWQGRRDSNPQLPRSEHGALPVELHPISGPRGSRTHNHPVNSRPLFLLSFGPKTGRGWSPFLFGTLLQLSENTSLERVVPRGGLEPPIARVRTGCFACLAFAAWWDR